MPHDWLTPWQDARDQLVVPRTTVWNLRTGPMPVGGVLVANPSKWTNPFRMAVSGMTRDQAVTAYACWLARRHDLLAALHELRGRVLCCWCHPARCHAHVLAALADAPPPWLFDPAAWAAGTVVRAA